MIYYAPEVLFQQRVTVVEMICASVCITSMISFTLEKRYRSERAMDSEYGANTRRMAARGNATSFPLPWQDLLAQLSAAEPDLQNAGEKSQVALPRTGSQLAEIVSVLLKASGDDEDVGALSKFIHQATVRRSIVVSLIQGAKERGHRAYVHLDMGEVTRKAQALPENGVPPEI